MENGNGKAGIICFCPDISLPISPGCSSCVIPFLFHIFFSRHCDVCLMRRSRDDSMQTSVSQSNIVGCLLLRPYYNEMLMKRARLIYVLRAISDNTLSKRDVLFVTIQLGVHENLRVFFRHVSTAFVFNAFYRILFLSC